MNVRKAKISDADSIHALVSSYAELDRMLFRSKADIYENLRSFTVAQIDGEVVGCCALQIIWEDLAEIKSLAVNKDSSGGKIGSSLVEAVSQEAAGLGIKQVFALTLEPGFFEKAGFAKVGKDALPMKVWSDCAKCPKQDHCDEIAVIRTL